MKTIANIIHQKTFPLEIDDLNGNRIFFETLAGWWAKRIFDANGKAIYFETSKGYIDDNRP